MDFCRANLIPGRLGNLISAYQLVHLTGPIGLLAKHSTAKVTLPNGLYSYHSP